MEKFVITITRQFGSMGRPIAKELAKRLGIEYYDRDIVDQAAKKLDLPVSVIKEEEETADNVNIMPYTRMVHPLGKSTTSVQDKIFSTQEKMIKLLADQESCIVVGRCADYILYENPNAMHVYIYAPYNVRLKNSIEKLNLSEQDARKLINEVDEARDKYHMTYAGFLPPDERFKDVMIDSNFLGLEGTVDILECMIKKRFGI